MKRLALLIFVTSLLATQTAFAGPTLVGQLRSLDETCRNASEGDPDVLVVTVLKNQVQISQSRVPRNSEPPQTQAIEVVYSKADQIPAAGGSAWVCQNGKRLTGVTTDSGDFQVHQ